MTPMLMILTVMFIFVSPNTFAQVPDVAQGIEQTCIEESRARGLQELRKKLPNKKPQELELVMQAADAQVQFVLQTVARSCFHQKMAGLFKTATWSRLCPQNRTGLAASCYIDWLKTQNFSSSTDIPLAIVTVTGAAFKDKEAKNWMRTHLYHLAEAPIITLENFSTRRNPIWSSANANPTQVAELRKMEAESFVKASDRLLVLAQGKLIESKNTRPKAGEKAPTDAELDALQLRLNKLKSPGL